MLPSKNDAGLKETELGSSFFPPYYQLRTSHVTNTVPLPLPREALLSSVGLILPASIKSSSMGSGIEYLIHERKSRSFFFVFLG
jgi:hypothetical protein